MKMAEPFLKWAGGKRWLAGAKVLPCGTSFSRLIEPFAGGAAVFFRLQPKRALLSDINGELISLYEVMRDHPQELWKAMDVHQAAHSVEHYYDVRSNVPNDLIGKAARTLYLNRTCWNGLYRVNRRGEFNVPIGTKTTVLFEGENFEGFSEALSRAELRRCDFSQSIDQAGIGDFLFVDPPYTVKHNLNGFVKYNETMFSWLDQVRLRDSLENAALRGASIMVTNADHESVRELYAGSFAYTALHRASVLAGSANKRGKTTEALFTVNCAALT